MEFTYLENFEAESRKVEYGIVESIDMSEFIDTEEEIIDYLEEII